jgi:Kdo2-lipid IVA lauroyltransferase/acyltransferase
MSRKKKSKALQAIEYVLYRIIRAAVTRASDERVARWGTRLGPIARRFLRRRDVIGMRNLRLIYEGKPESELRAIMDECWRHFGREILLLPRFQSMTIEQVLERCSIENQHLLEEARALGKGVVLISGHYGGWELGGLAVMATVDDVRTVVRPLDNEYLNRALARTREATGVAVIDRRRAARPLMKGLAENAVVVLLPDQAVQPREGVLVPFLGRPAWTTDAPAKMAARHGSPIVFVFCIPDGLRHRLVFEEPIRVDRLTEDERDPVALTARINEVISRRIAERPELWLWMHDRWKGTGESEVGDG